MNDERQGLDRRRHWSQGAHVCAEWKSFAEEHQQDFEHPVRYFPDGAECRVCDVFWVAPLTPDQLEARGKVLRVLEGLLEAPLGDVDLVEATWNEMSYDEEGFPSSVEIHFELHGRLPLRVRHRLPATVTWERRGFVTTGTLRLNGTDLRNYLRPATSTASVPSAMLPVPGDAPKPIEAHPDSPSRD